MADIKTDLDLVSQTLHYAGSYSCDDPDTTFYDQANEALVASGRVVALIEQQQARIAGLEADLATQIQIGVTDAEEMDQLLERAEAAESALAQADAREADSRHCFKRIIQVRAGDGMLQGKEALDEMARLAGEALSRLDQPESG